MEVSEVETLRTRLKLAEESARDYEEKMLQAAQYGQDLLERNQELEQLVDTTRQDKYEISLRLQAKLSLEKSLCSELESTREQLRQEEVRRLRLQEEEDERWSRREEVWRAKVLEAEASLGAAEAKEKLLVERLETAEKQLAETNSALNRTVLGDSISSELESLHQENISLLQEKQLLESEVQGLRQAVEEEKMKGRSLEARLETQAREIEELQCQISGYIRSVEVCKEEIQGLEAQLVAAREVESAREGKGNSLFSEVEDRRQKVEWQLKLTNERYAQMKESYDRKVQDLQKVKLQNAQLLSIAGTRGDSEHVERLEELLSVEREKSRTLGARLEAMTRLEVRDHSTTLGDLGSKMADMNLSDGREQQQLLVNQENLYLANLLTEAQAKNKELQDELRKQVQQSLVESDHQRELCRQLHTLETQIKQIKSANYAYKAQIDELLEKKTEVKKSSKKPAQKNVEQLKFDDFDPASVGVGVGGRVPPAPPLVLTPTEEKENKPQPAIALEKRRGISISDTVSEMDQEGTVVQAAAAHLLDRPKKKLESRQKARRAVAEVARPITETDCNQQ